MNRLSTKFIGMSIIKKNYVFHFISFGDAYVLSNQLCK